MNFSNLIILILILILLLVAIQSNSMPLTCYKCNIEKFNNPNLKISVNYDNNEQVYVPIYSPWMRYLPFSWIYPLNFVPNGIVNQDYVIV
jgi:hypothetical protein